MARYIKRARPEPTDEEFLALLILLGPLAFVAWWIGRSLLCSPAIATLGSASREQSCATRCGTVSVR